MSFHIEEAKRVLNVVGDAAERSTITPAEAQACIGVAQVRALLAIAETLESMYDHHVWSNQ